MITHRIEPKFLLAIIIRIDGALKIGAAIIIDIEFVVVKSKLPRKDDYRNNY